MLNNTVSKQLHTHTHPLRHIPHHLLIQPYLENGPISDSVNSVEKVLKRQDYLPTVFVESEKFMDNTATFYVCFLATHGIFESEAVFEAVFYYEGSENFESFRKIHIRNLQVLNLRNITIVTCLLSHFMPQQLHILFDPRLLREKLMQTIPKPFPNKHSRPQTVRFLLLQFFLRPINL